MDSILGRYDEHGHSRFKRAQLGNTISREALTSPERLTGPQARALRGHYARLAELFARRSEEALAGGNGLAAVRCQREYSRCVRRCRALGEIVHAGTAVANGSPGVLATAHVSRAAGTPEPNPARVVGALTTKRHRSREGCPKDRRLIGYIAIDRPAPARAGACSGDHVLTTRSNTNETLEWRHNRCPRIRAGR